MHIISQKKIKEGCLLHPECASALKGWLKLIKQSNPGSFAELKQLFNSIDKVGEFHVFNIGGNKLRLIAFIDYRFHKIFIRDILTHEEYDKRRIK